ncbi:MAG: SDR family oxidoreductase [Sphaerochaeta sp.]|nr:SDR family oxidoreductase [Sphaerochaeta sp.]
MESWFKEDVLNGYTVLVIGASTESGPAVCRVLAQHGARVAFTYLKNIEAAHHLQTELQSLGCESKPYPFDLFSMDQVWRLPQQVSEEFGRLDILVNLGGPPPVYTDLHELKETEFDAMMDTHFKANFFLSLKMARLMEQGSGGVVVNVSATSSMKCDHSVYGLAKACQREMTGFLAQTFAPKVRFVTLVPGLIGNNEVDATLREKRAQISPLKRVVTAKELGQLVVMACSPAFTSITGTSLLADAGFSLLHP